MKTVVLCFLLLFIAVLHGQWEANQNLTSNDCSNTNVTFYTNQEFKDGDKSYLVWEKEESEGSKSIALYSYENRDFTELATYSIPGTMLSQPKLHLTNEEENLLTLFYEVALPGSVNTIDYVYYRTDGTFSEPLHFSDSGKSSSGLQISYYKAIWEEEGSILTSDHSYGQGWSTPETVDSGDCSSPALSTNGLNAAWLNNKNDSSKIYLKNYGWKNDRNSDPVQIHSGQDISALNFNNGISDGWGSNLLWTEKKDFISQVFYYPVDRQKTVHQLDYQPQKNKYQPTSVMGRFVSKDYFDPLLAFSVEDESGSNQIYLKGDFFSQMEFENVSAGEYENRNPQLYGKLNCNSYGYIENEILLIWETLINGKWQLMLKRASISAGSIEDEGILSADATLQQNYPNPFNPETTINYELQINNFVNVAVYNAAGEMVWETGEREQEAGKYTVKFNGSALNSGIYYYALKIKGKTQQIRKMVLVK